jgi:hypothetical protein
MKHLKLVLGASLVSVVIAAVAADRPAPQPFKIQVQLTGSEVKMRCVSGCYWVTTTYSCGSAKSCSFDLDESGVNGTVPPAAR